MTAAITRLLGGGYGPARTAEQRRARTRRRTTRRAATAHRQDEFWRAKAERARGAAAEAILEFDRARACIKGTARGDLDAAIAAWDALARVLRDHNTAQGWR